MRSLCAKRAVVSIAFASSLIALAGCPSLGRISGACEFIPGPNWNSFHFGWEQAPNLICPLEVAHGGDWKTYGATVNGPFNQIQAGGQLRTDIYADDHWTYRNGNAATFRNTGANIGKADISVVYWAGGETAYGQYQSDYADNYVALAAGGSAQSEVVLAYDIYTLAVLSGSASPAPGTTATWTASVRNAPAPYTYRWFKNDVELTGQTSATLQLPITTSFFRLKLIAGSADGSRDTLLVNVVPNWSVTIFGMTDIGPSVHCGYDASTGNNSSAPFTYQWSLDGVTLPDQTETANPDMSGGSHTLEVFITDANGYTAKTSITINVHTGGPSNCT